MFPTVTFAEPVRPPMFVSSNDIVPEEDQHALIYWRDQDKIGCFEIGRIANKLIENAALSGTRVSKSDVYRAVGSFAGKGRTTILYYAQVAAAFPPEIQEEYSMLAFCHFAFARKMGARSREVLEYAKSKPYITEDELFEHFSTDLIDLSTENAQETITSALSVTESLQSSEDAYKQILVNLYSLKDELERTRSHLPLTRETRAKVDDILSDLSQLLPRVAFEIGVQLA